MASAPAALLRYIHRLADPPAAQSDALLLQRFTAQRDEAAFAALLRRHGWLVWGVCRHILHDEQDAEDAFQTTFLVLARRPTAIRKYASLASWLHGVAYRIAVRAKKRSAQRQRRERQVESRQPQSLSAELAVRELQAILDEELHRLPEKYRAPFILCCLEGRSWAAAAADLGWKEGTVSSRIALARRLLRERLARRGVLLSAVLMAHVLAGQVATAGVPTALLQPTLQTARLAAAGQGTVNGTAAALAALVDSGLPALTGTKLKLAVALLVTLGACTLGGMLARPAPVNKEAKTRPPVLQPLADDRAPKTDAHGDPLPDGAIHRLGTLRFRQGGGYVNRLLLTPDGKTLVSKSYYGEGSVAVWDFPSGKLLHRLPGHYDENRAVAVSPDGKMVATGQDAVISFWDAATGKELRQLKSPIGKAEGLAFSPDGKVLASGHGGHSVQLWDVDAGKVLAKLPAQHNRSGLLAFSPDGKTLATGDPLDKTIRLFDVAARRERQKLERPSVVHDLAFSPDGTMLAAGGQDGTIPLWDVATGKLLRELRGPGAHVRAVAWSPDGKTLATSDYQEKSEVVSIRLWDVATGKEQRHIDGSWGLVESLLFAADDKTLISGGRDSVIRLWDVATGADRSPAAGNDTSVWCLALSPEGKMLAYTNRRGIDLWDVAARRQVGTLPGHHWSFTFSPDGKMLAGGSDINATRLWDVAGRRPLRTLATDLKKMDLNWVAVRHVVFAPDGKTLASCGHGYGTGARQRDVFVYLWDPATGEELRRLDFRDTPDDLDTIEAVAISPDGRTLVASGRAEPKAGRVRAWDLATGKVLVEVTTAINNWFPTWDNLHKIQSPIVEPHVVFSPDGRLLALNCVEKSIPVWEAVTGRERCRLEGHDGPTACVVFAPDGRTLASAGYDQTIRLWDVETGKELRKLTGHRGKTNALAFTPDGKTLISGGDDTTVLFWDVAGVTRRARPTTRLTFEESEVLWKELAKTDATKAHQAISRLAAAPGTAAALRERLRPAPKLDTHRLERLLGDLGSEDFAARELATRDIEKLGERARPAIERALARTEASLEVRRRLERLQARLAVPAGEYLQELRALEVLERLATPDAQRLLQELIAGAVDAHLTREAKASLTRLAAR
jgi:RNA polymerase sigma factor (sigma-70 family)